MLSLEPTTAQTEQKEPVSASSSSSGNMSPSPPSPCPVSMAANVLTKRWCFEEGSDLEARLVRLRRSAAAFRSICAWSATAEECETTSRESSSPSCSSAAASTSPSSSLVAGGVPLAFGVAGAGGTTTTALLGGGFRAPRPPNNWVPNFLAAGAAATSDPAGGWLQPRPTPWEVAEAAEQWLGSG